MQLVAGFHKREVQALGLIGFTHLMSHLYLLPLAPLLLALEGDLGINKAEFGLALAAYAITTGVLQTPMGLLVERIGGRVVMIVGLIVTAASFVAIGLLATDFWSLALLLAVAGIGNSVFHPADYALLSAAIDDRRMGRAFSLHTMTGHLGFLAGPVSTAALEPFLGWRGAVVAIGVVGLVMALVLIAAFHKIPDSRTVKKKDASIRDSLRDLLSSPAILLFFAFYTFASMATFGMTQFSVAAFQDIYGLERVTAVTALTAYQIGALVLVLPGGYMADRVSRYDAVIIGAFALSAVLVLLAGTVGLPFWICVGLLAVAGALRGGVNAARDVAVRDVARHLPIGTVFGFVTTGFLVGQAVAGPLYGFLYDLYSPRIVFYISAAASVAAIATIMVNPGTRRAARAVE